MLVLKNITKQYMTGDNAVHALQGVDIAFRDSEFVSVLGPSGCGKTTLLNIVGGLDQYTDGDLVINGRSTKQYGDRDWDVYRNHTIGFVFQSYNLIPHQTVLSNVELAMTLSGVSKSERRRRAVEALEKVGLGDQIKKKPNQMSGGQMQRVAIARALVNNPDILLADEPTGALDTGTSVQIMEILKEISKDRLVIMVTHNPDLAERYSTRIVSLLDGRVTGDTDPYDPEEEQAPVRAEKSRKEPLSFFTALSLSLTNLMTKKTRTFLTAFAGSIGIIGIALILALSNGITTFIERVEEDTLSSYPITINSEEYDMTAMLTAVMSVDRDGGDHGTDAVYSSTTMADLMDSMLSLEETRNDLRSFKQYIESGESGADQYLSDVMYTYGITLNIYASDTSEGIVRINPSSVFENMTGGFSGGDGAPAAMSVMRSTNRLEIWQEMLDNRELMNAQYDVIAGRWPESFDEVVLVVDKNNELNDLYLYSLGFKDPDELQEIMQGVMRGEKINSETEEYSYDEILDTTYKLVLSTDYYNYDGDTGTWVDMSGNDAYMEYLVKNGIDIRIVGIIRPSEDALASSLSGAIGYTGALTEYVLDAVNSSEIVKSQLGDPDTDVISGLPFDDGAMDDMTDAEKAQAVTEYLMSLGSVEKAAVFAQIAAAPSEEEIAAAVSQQIAAMDRQAMDQLLTQAMSEQAGMDDATIAAYLASLSDEEAAGYVSAALAERYTAEYTENIQAQLGAMTADETAVMFDARIAEMTDTQLAEIYDEYMPAQVSDSTYEENLSLLGVADADDPKSINLYASTFDNKDEIVRVIDEYNRAAEAAGDETKVINYSDYVGLLMSSVTTVINIISYVLIAFVSISLVVSSIMIGIITYISVLERTKEIGILRSIGASKRDISRVFNAETLIVGFASGAIGIIITLLLCWPASAIIERLTGVGGLAVLPWQGGVILVLISMALTLIAGLIPARIAARKDPVEALRTE